MSLNSTGFDPKFLPNLPGYKPKPIPSGTKKHCFKVVDGQAFLRDEYIPQSTSNEFDEGTSINSFTTTTINKARKQLALTNANIILNFAAYFQEYVEGSNRPQVRLCNIYFYVEDGSVKVVEKPILNSGVSQGTLVKRAVIPKSDGTPYVEEDFRIGDQVQIYGRVFR